MVLVINGQEADWRPQGSTVDEIRQEVGAWALDQGQALWELKLNGEHVDWDESGTATDGNAVIEIVTREMGDLTTGLVNEAVGYIPRLTVALASVSESVYSGDEEEALGLFGDCLEGLEWVIQTMRLMMGIDKQFAAMCAVSDSEQDAKATEQALEEIEEALRLGDTVLMADIIQTSLCPALEQWAQGCTAKVE